jgi:hypothetical protein
VNDDVVTCDPHKGPSRIVALLDDPFRRFVHGEEIVLDDSKEQILLRWKVVIDGSDVDVRQFGDFPHTGPAESLTAEQVDSDADDPHASIGDALETDDRTRVCHRPSLPGP